MKICRYCGTNLLWDSVRGLYNSETGSKWCDTEIARLEYSGEHRQVFKP